MEKSFKKNYNILKEKMDNITKDFQDIIKNYGIDIYRDTKINSIENICVLAEIMINLYKKGADIDIQDMLYKIMEYENIRQTINCAKDIAEMSEGNFDNIIF